MPDLKHAKKRSQNWTFDQLCLCANSLDRKKVNFGWLAKAINRHGPLRDDTGVRAKRENLRSWQYSDDHAGLSHGGALDKIVLVFRITDPVGFERHCASLR